MVETNLYGEDITKVRRQQFEVSICRDARAVGIHERDRDESESLRPLPCSISGSATRLVVIRSS